MSIEDSPTSDPSVLIIRKEDATMFPDHVGHRLWPVSVGSTPFLFCWICSDCNCCTWVPSREALRIINREQQA